MKIINKKQGIFEKAVVLTIAVTFIAGAFTAVVSSQDENLDLGESIDT